MGIRTVRQYTFQADLSLKKLMCLKFAAKDDSIDQTAWESIFYYFYFVLFISIINNKNQIDQM